MYLCVANATPSETDSRESAIEAETSLDKPNAFFDILRRWQAAYKPFTARGFMIGPLGFVGLAVMAKKIKGAAASSRLNLLACLTRSQNRAQSAPCLLETVAIKPM
eukprot:scaffold266334_cov30-Prasinocladus_malaysianus.AAC.1